jgi:Tfp pilus assembly protein PilF
MKTAAQATILLILLVLVLVLAPGARAKAERRTGILHKAQELFAAAEFATAQAAYEQVLAKEPRSYEALLGLGQIEVLSNRLDSAEAHLRQAVELKPKKKEPKALLAEVHYRRLEFDKAAVLFREIGREAVARKLASFRGARPYRIEGSSRRARLEFVRTDPLPVVQVRVQGGAAVNFLIDTGADEVILDTELARQAGAEEFGGETGEYAGGRKAQALHGRIGSLGLGELVLHDVPVRMMSTKRFAAAAGGLRIDGILGTVLFYQFLATLDYPGGALLLEPRPEAGAEAPTRSGGGTPATEVPFWMAGDHLLLAWGTAGKSGPILMLVDTGLAGGGFAAPDSTLKEAGVSVDSKAAVEGVGGGGTVRVVPFVLDRLSLGDAVESGIVGFAGVFPPSLEKDLGFRVGGLISHQFFRSYRLSFDFSRMVLALNRSR